MSEEKTTQDKLKEQYLHWLGKLQDKKLAADKIGVTLVDIRSLRQKDPVFNKDYKRLVVGKKDAKTKIDRKEEFIALVEKGLSQREACDELHIGIAAMRTWKKTDEDFKDRVNAGRRA